MKSVLRGGLLFCLVLLLMVSVQNLARRRTPQTPWVVYASDRSGNYEIYRTRPDGSNRRNLTQHPAGDTIPVWSPDGQWIAFSSNRDGNNDIYIMRPNGSGLKNLTRHPSHDLYPDWSPDSQWIIFSSNRDGEIGRAHV